MVRLNHQTGFTLIGMLISVAIVGVLMVMMLNSSGSFFGTSSGNQNTNALGMDMTKTMIRQLHQAELRYHGIHGTYATFAELIQTGTIARSYTNRALGAGTPIVRNYDVEIEVSRNGFVITATPNHQAGAGPNSPVLKIDLSGRVEEVWPE